MELENINYLADIPEDVAEDKFADFAYDGITDLNTNIEVYTDVLGEDVAVVTGNPFEAVEQLDFSQGDNSYDAGGCCGLVSSSNFLNLCGLETTEEEIVGYAMENGLCENSPFMPSESKGATDIFNVETIIESYGIPVTAYDTYNGGTIEDIANAVDEGKVVAIGVNAGYLWDEPNYIDDGRANHMVTVTGAVHNVEGEVIGLVICDSGRGLEGDACRVVSKDEMELCYESVPGASAIITDYSVR